MTAQENAGTAPDFARRLLRLEDEAAIQRLVHIYARLCDAAYDPDGLAALFTEDAVWAAASPDGKVDFGRHDGRAQIRSFFAGASKTIGPMTLHYVTNPIIDVADDRRTATGQWHSLTFMERGPEGSGERPTFMLGSRYYHSYRNVDGIWRFSGLDCIFGFDRPLMLPFDEAVAGNPAKE